MKNHRIEKLTLGALLSITLSACSSDRLEEVIPAEEDVYLKVETSMGETRNVVTSSTFSSGDAIGLYIKNSGGVSKASNIKATYSSNQWSLASNFKVSSYGEDSSLTVYAYYPFDSATTQHGDSIDIDICYVEGKGQPDFLYGSCANIYKDNPTAHIYFKHALSRLTFSITNPTESDVNVTEVTVEESGGWLETKARMSLADGGIRTLGGESIVTVPVDISIPKGEKRDVDVLLLPNKGNVISDGPKVMPHKAKLSFVIDGETHSISFSPPSRYANQQYTYPVTLLQSINGGDPILVEMR